MSSFSIPRELPASIRRAISDDISSDVIERATKIAQDAFVQVARDEGRTPEESAQGHFMSIRSHLNFAFKSVLFGKIESLLAAALITQEMLDMQRAYADVEAFKAKRRSMIAAQLRSSRGKLRKLRSEVQALESRAADLHANIKALGFSAHGKEFQCAPPPLVAPTRGGKAIPKKPGIYFVWLDGSIVYVGKSTNLNRRVTLAHQNIHPGDMISFIECDPVTLEFTESFYIGYYMPRRNYARSAYLNAKRISAAGVVATS